MKDEGWVKSYRQTLENPVVMRDVEHFALWEFLLLKVVYIETDVDFDGKRITLQPGQFTTGRNKIAEKLKINDSKVDRILKRFENEQMIKQQMGVKCRLITVINWHLYQGTEQQNEQQLSSKRAATEQLLSTNKEYKNKRKKELKNTDSPIGEQATPEDPEAYKKKLNPQVSEIILSLQEKLGLPTLDKSVQHNRRMANLALKKFGLEQVKLIIDVAAQDAYWKSRVTSMSDIYYNGLKIVSTKRFPDAPKVKFI